MKHKTNIILDAAIGSGHNTIDFVLGSMMTNKEWTEPIDAALPEHLSQSTSELMRKVSRTDDALFDVPEDAGLSKFNLFLSPGPRAVKLRQLEESIRICRDILEVQRRILRASRRGVRVVDSNHLHLNPGKLERLAAIDHELTAEETVDYATDPILVGYVHTLIQEGQIKP